MSAGRDGEAALVARMASGDSGRALEEFYSRFSGIVMAVLVRILGSRADAEELLHDVFVELWRRAPQYERERAAVSTWVVTVARSRALDALRARRRRRIDQQVATEDLNLPAPREEGPDERALAGQRSRAVREALGLLGADQRQALELAYFGGLSHSEIAAQLELPIGTVKSRILAAMKVLREAMTKIAEEAV